MLRWLLLVAVCAAPVGGCGGESESRNVPSVPPVPQKLDVTLNGYPGPETVGILMAEERGYFDEVGLEMWIRTPGSRLRPLQYVAERAVALAVSHQPQVLLSQAKDVPIEAFGTLVSKPTGAMIWLRRSTISDLDDLGGKTIGITGLPYERAFLEAILAQAGLGLEDVEVRRFDYDLLPAIVSGKVDAIFGSWNIEGAELEARGLDPVITPVVDLGLPPYEELVLIARSDRLAKNPEPMRNFMKALARGNAAAAADPSAAARLIAEWRAENVTEATKAKVAATLPLLSTSGETDLDPDRAEELRDWMEAR